MGGNENKDNVVLRNFMSTGLFIFCIYVMVTDVTVISPIMPDAICGEECTCDSCLQILYFAARWKNLLTRSKSLSFYLKHLIT